MSEYKMILGDCLDVMKTMDSESVDVVFTSPPYNDAGKENENGKHTTHMKYENVEFRKDWFEWQRDCIDEMLRVSRRYVLYNVQAILTNKANVYKLIGHYSEKIHQILIWYKPNAQPQPMPHRIGNYYEMVLIIKGPRFECLRINSERYENVIIKNISSNHVYSEKHRALMSEPFCDEVIREFTTAGDVVLDPFAGLATTGVCCNRQGRDFIGIEIHKPYFEMAKDRMERETAQFTLFD